MMFPTFVIAEKSIYIAPFPLNEMYEDYIRSGKYKKTYIIHEKTGKLYRISEATPNIPLPRWSRLKKILYFIRQHSIFWRIGLKAIPSKIKYKEIGNYNLENIKKKIECFYFFNKYTSLVSDNPVDDEIIFEHLKKIESFSEFIVLIALAGYLLDYEKGYKKVGIPRGKPQYFTEKADKEFVQKKIKELAAEINYTDYEV